MMHELNLEPVALVVNDTNLVAFLKRVEFIEKYEPDGSHSGIKNANPLLMNYDIGVVERGKIRSMKSDWDSIEYYKPKDSYHFRYKNDVIWFSPRSDVLDVYNAFKFRIEAEVHPA